MPEAVKNGTQEMRQAWLQVFKATPAGKEYLAAHPGLSAPPSNFTLEFATDHQFRIQNVPPGDYMLVINPQPRRHGGRVLGLGVAVFTIPQVPGGVSDDPVVVPDIVLTGN